MYKKKQLSREEQIKRYGHPCEVCGKPAHYKNPTCSLQCRGAQREAAKYTLPTPPPVKGARWLPLTVGKFALVDADKYEWIKANGPWFFHKNVKTPPPDNGYAAQRLCKDGEIQKIVYLHRFIFGATEEQMVDHKSRSTLDCRLENLRLADFTHNNRNRGKHRRANAKSRFKGVYRPSGCVNRWAALITVNDKGIRLGNFDTEEEAAEAYDAAALKHFGEFACINFPEKKAS